MRGPGTAATGSGSTVAGSATPNCSNSSPATRCCSTTTSTDCPQGTLGQRGDGRFDDGRAGLLSRPAVAPSQVDIAPAGAGEEGGGSVLNGEWTDLEAAVGSAGPQRRHERVEEAEPLAGHVAHAVGRALEDVVGHA